MSSLSAQIKVCMYCCEQLEMCLDEGLECFKCKGCVHLRCLKRGSVPGGINGDVFYTFTCNDCSENDGEKFVRIKMSWLQILCLVLHHLQTRSPGLARRGFFHFRHHIATFIDKQWSILCPNDVKKKKNWMGTVAGTLSHFSGFIFLSGFSVFKEQAWWTLYRPKLTPQVLSDIYLRLLNQKQLLKQMKKKIPPDAELFETILHSIVKNEAFLEHFSISLQQSLPTVPIIKPPPLDEFENNEDLKNIDNLKVSKSKNSNSNKRQAGVSLAGHSKKMKQETEEFATGLVPSDSSSSPSSTLSSSKKNDKKPNREFKMLDPFCHYNTSLNNISKLDNLTLQTKLMGGIKQDLILSPYSQLHLKPYIRQDCSIFPAWLRLMAEVQLAVNENSADFKLPPRGPIDYTYVQPEHIPAINSLCNQFFWPGIDLAETLQYPDFSCVALYKKLIIGFAFLVPNITATENYMSFIFTRPYWRNCGIAKFMIYHLIQTSLGKDITLHVSINNPALFLYQKFGFKVEDVVLDFYDKYYRSDVRECKHAFYCRLER